jgi:hypothetical protein
MTTRVLVTLAALAATAAWATQTSDQALPRHYSTCGNFHGTYGAMPDPQALLGLATERPTPTPTDHPEVIRVRVYVHGTRVFCATAINGPMEKQEFAVKTVMKWRFEPRRDKVSKKLIGVVDFLI